MQITFHGAAQTVTGSQHLLELNGARVLLDCGLYQGSRQESNYRNSHFLYEPEALDAVVLSHAHIDHSGPIPNLVRRGFQGPVYATPATADLCQYMLRDSGRIQEYDAEYLNRRARKRGEPAKLRAAVHRGRRGQRANALHPTNATRRRSRSSPA